MEILQNVKYVLWSVVCYYGCFIYSGYYIVFVSKDGYFVKISDINLILGFEFELFKGFYFLFYDRIEFLFFLYINFVL